MGVIFVLAILAVFVDLGDKSDQIAHQETVAAAATPEKAPESNTVTAPEPTPEPVVMEDAVITEEPDVIEETVVVEEADASADSNEENTAAEPTIAAENENITGEDADDSAAVPDEKSSAAAVGSHEVSIGDTIEVEPGLYLTVNDIRASVGDGFFEADGVYIIIDCTYENRSKKEANLSTLINLSVKDSDGYKYTVALFADTKGSLDGALAVGDKTRGEVAFDVPDGTTVEYFCYDPFLVSGYNQARWRLSVTVWE